MPYNCFDKEILVYNALSSRILKGEAGVSGSVKLKDEEINSVRKTETQVELQMHREKSGRSEITLIAKENFLSGNSDVCYILVQTHGVVNMVKEISLKSGTVKINLPEEIFIPGINQIVIFNSALKPLTERFIYTPQKQEANFRVSSADSFSTRKKVEIIIASGLVGGDSLLASSTSLSVTSGEGSFREGDITDYMVFGSEFGNLPESFRNRRLEGISLDSVDKFLLNAKSNWIDWNYVMSGKLPEIKFNAEKDGHIITGQLIQKNTLEPLKGKYMFLSVPGKTATFQYSLTDSAGLFSFTVPINEKVNDFIIQPEESGLKSSVMIGIPVAEDFLKSRDNYDTLVLEIPEYLTKWGVNYQVSKIYGVRNTADPVSDTNLHSAAQRFYGRPDIELIMADYILLPLMEEVFFELTPGVQLKRKGDIYSMTIEDPVTRNTHKKPPVLFVDGIVVKDPAIFAGIDPETVEKIDVIKDLYLVGNYIFFGIINVITKNGNLSGISLPDDAIRFKYRVVEPVPSFIAPVYSSEELRNSRIPDFRNTLYWNSSLQRSEGGVSVAEFWTSDGKGTFEINLQGIDNYGKPVSFRKTISVN